MSQKLDEICYFVILDNVKVSLPDFSSFVDILPDSGKIMLCTHRHPDPDGLGAIVGLQHLLKMQFDIDSDLVLEGRIRRAENVTMRELLHIDAVPERDIDPASYSGLIIVDSQPCFSHTHPPEGIPLLAIFDHHEGEGENAQALFEWVDCRYGATSTMIYDMYQHFAVVPNQRVATALFCGVRYDTNNLLRGAIEPDERAFKALEKLSDRRILGAIDEPPLTREYFQQMYRAISCCEDYGLLLLTLMEEVVSPESVAEIADWFLRLEGQQWSLSGGACDGRYQISLRCDLEGADAYPVLKHILGDRGSCGGHGRMAGGQIELEGDSLEEIKAYIKHRALAFFEIEGVAPLLLKE